TGLGEARTAQDLVVRVGAPRLFREGDEVLLPVSVGNRSGADEEVRLALSARGAAVEGAAERTLEVPAGAEATELFRMRGFVPGEVLLKAVARGARAADAVEFPVPCEPKGMRTGAPSRP
ncbi:MAG: hypothetical protein MUC63_10595, partial [Planctomycetes bacterium]|nr:hypothetical protein [Planctomycetota bacterium]